MYTAAWEDEAWVLQNEEEDNVTICWGRWEEEREQQQQQLEEEEEDNNWRKRTTTTGGRGQQQLEEEDNNNWRKRTTTTGGRGQQQLEEEDNWRKMRTIVCFGKSPLLAYMMGRMQKLLLLPDERE
ncbi:hypothetical protein Pmani_035930 [Petrolisthes manimaculis]|uniref:Uncharacterized protein n=1 Tax=Petrolisthes manimaculis TaxID=1843537 RepID=A0AAE1NLZ8_9EUCA|nr:hypothetical protein Pmani_035930 [Petrolisthes manimaculis]